MRSALDLSPEKMAFIHGATEKPSNEVAIELEAKAEPEKTIVESPPRAPRERTERRRSEKAREEGRDALPEDEVSLIPPFNVPLTTRLQPKTANALRRAYLEQKLNGRTPATQQEIVEAALVDWLRRNDYLS